MKPIVLTFTHYYLPGNLAGGPIRSISNMVELLGDEFDFYIITSDRDFNASTPYENVTIDTWCKVGKANVYYASSSALSFWRLAQLIRQTKHDLLYLNSFFDPSFTILPLLLRYLGLLPKNKLLIAPRGEFSDGAFAIKHWKKASYTFLSNLLGFYNDANWHASTDLEKTDIINHLFCHSKFESEESFSNLKLGQTEAISHGKIKVASDLVSISSDRNNELCALYEFDLKYKINQEHLKVCFLSRIAAMKNLDFALKVMANVRVPIIFDIYGPQEDMAYWLICKDLINKLPTYVQVNYLGSVEHERVTSTISRYNLFFLPTLGENFGHVIYEALVSGTPVLISDKTPWLDLEQYGVGWALSLNKPEKFVSVIEEVASWNMHQWKNVVENAVSYASQKANSSEIIEKNLDLIKSALI